MNEQDQTAIEGLFDRLKQAESQSGPRDGEAEQLIASLVKQQPAAPYLMAQAVLVQEHGLRQLQSRVETLEQELASRPQAGGGFLGGLFGGGAGASAAPAATAMDRAGSRSEGRSGGWGSQSSPAQAPAAAFQRGQSGGFLAGAAQTAMGVAGGVLLGNAIAGMFAGDAEAAPAEAAPAPDAGFADEAAADPEMPAEDDLGGFFDGFGDEEF